MAFRLPTSLWVFGSGQSGKCVSAAASLEAKRTVDHLVADGDRQSAQQFRIHIQLKRNGATVDTGEQFGEPGTLSVGELACGADVGDDFAPPRHREIRQFADGLVGAFAMQQLDRLAQQIRGVPARPAR